MCLCYKKEKKKGLQRIRILNWATQECSEGRQFLQQQKTLKCFERGELEVEGWGDRGGGGGGGGVHGQGSSLLSVRHSR